MKKLISILLSVSLLLTVCFVPVYAEEIPAATDYELDGSYPYIFVHGMGGRNFFCINRHKTYSKKK